MNTPPSASPSPPAQLALDFDRRPALGGEDFLVAPPNAEAVRWLDAWPRALLFAKGNPRGKTKAKSKARAQAKSKSAGKSKAGKKK